MTSVAPHVLWRDSIAGVLYFADAQANSVSVWINAAMVDGNARPDRILTGPGLIQPNGIAVDPFRNRLYIVNRTGEILIWNDAAAVTGNAPPTAVIARSSTGLVPGDHPIYLDVKSDTLYLANGTQILVFEKLGQSTGDKNIAPVRTIRIADLSRAGLAGDPIRDLLFVSSREANGTIHRLTGASAALGKVAPAATLAGPETGLNQTSAVTLAGNVLMALNLAGTEIPVWHQADQKNGDASPTQIIEMASALPTALFYVAT